MYVFYVFEINLSILVYFEVSLLFFSFLGEFYQRQLVVPKVAKNVMRCVSIYIVHPSESNRKFLSLKPVNDNDRKTCL